MESETSIHRGKGHNMVFVKLSHEVHSKISMLVSKETLPMTARILRGSVTTQLELWGPE